MLNHPTLHRPQRPPIATGRVTIRGLQEKKYKTFTVYGGTVDDIIERALAAFADRGKPDQEPRRKRAS
jgi:hypothetical protein